MTDQTRTRHNAMALTLHRLRDQDQAAAYGLIPTLCKPDAVIELMDMVIHFADATAVALEQAFGSKEAAADALQQQLYKEHH